MGWKEYDGQAGAGATEVNYYFCIELLFLSLAPADCSSVLNLPSLHPVFVSGS